MNISTLIQYTNKKGNMAERCRPGKSPQWYKWCMCMDSCGSVEDKYWIYAKGAINGLDLIRELYDDTVLHISQRRWFLTEKTYEKEKRTLLIQQNPYPRKRTWAEIVKE